MLPEGYTDKRRFLVFLPSCKSLNPGYLDSDRKIINDFADTVFTRCIHDYPLSNYLRAMSDYNQAVAIDVNTLAAINNIGFIKYEQGDKKTAIKQWQKAIEINHKSAETTLALAVALYDQGEQQKAYQLAEIALKIDKNIADFYSMKKNFWGQSMITDAQKFLLTPHMKVLLSQF